VPFLVDETVTVAKRGDIGTASEVHTSVKKFSALGRMRRRLEAAKRRQAIARLAPHG
jgi:hypothetical protein